MSGRSGTRVGLFSEHDWANSRIKSSESDPGPCQMDVANVGR